MKKFSLIVAMLVALFTTSKMSAQVMEVTAMNFGGETLLYSEGFTVDEPIAIDLFDEQGFAGSVILENVGGSQLVGFAYGELMMPTSQLMLGEAYGAVSGIGIGPVVVESDIPDVTHAGLPADVQDRLLDLQSIDGIKNYGSNDFGDYKNNTDPKLPEGGDYMEIYVTGKTGDGRRLVYDRDSGDVYYTPDHYGSWKKITDPWHYGGPKF